MDFLWHHLEIRGKKKLITNGGITKNYRMKSSHFLAQVIQNINKRHSIM